MTQATKTLGILFLVTVALVGLRLAFKGTGTSAALAGTVIQFEKAKISRVDVKHPERGHITLQKTLNGWTVQKNGDDKQFPADAEAVESALSQITDLKPKALLTRNPADFSRYQVDSTGTEVLLFNGDKEVAGIVVGRFQFVSQQEFNTYVKAVNSDEVVAVNGFIGSYFSKTLDSWRDKQVVKFDKKSVTQLDFGYPDSSFTIKKVGENAWMTALDSLDSGKVDAAIGKLADFKATGFKDDLTPDLFGKETYRIVAHLDNGLKQEVFFKPDPDKDTELLGKAIGYEYVFTVSKSSLTSSLLKGKTHFLK